MIEKTWLPQALAIGVSYHEFWSMNPHIIQNLMEGHRMKQRMQDEQMWLMGMYIQSAVSVAVEHNLQGRKAKSKYIEKPFLQQDGSEDMKNPESNETVAAFEMRTRINILRKQGLPESPL